jgi:hypothetical protein
MGFVIPFCKHGQHFYRLPRRHPISTSFCRAIADLPKAFRHLIGFFSLIGQDLRPRFSYCEPDFLAGSPFLGGRLVQK